MKADTALSRVQAFKRIASRASAVALCCLCFPASIDSFAATPVGRAAEEEQPVFGNGVHFGSSTAPDRTVHNDYGGVDTHRAQTAGIAYWQEVKASGRPIDRAVVVELYRRAGHFSIIHALLASGVITAADSRQIGRERAALHTEALNMLAASRRFGDRIGINDFGSGEMNAKSDIDFTLYPSETGADGAAMVEAYKAFFRSLTGGIDPSRFDLVAHRYEATIPDWRQAGSSAEFAARVRQGSRLLGSNPEAYFLEGAYVNQIMARSVDPERQTFTWIEQTDDGPKHTRMNVIASELPFFYQPDSRARNAFGSAVGNWHFFNAHADDRVAGGKYLLRSLNGTKTTLNLSHALTPFEKLTSAQRLETVRALYGHMFADVAPAARELKLHTVLAALETAMHIRERKSGEITDLGPEAYRPLVDLERASWPKNMPVDEATLVEIARAHVDHYWPTLLVENNIRAAGERLGDWLSPPIRVGQDYRTLDRNGQPTTIRVDAETLRRYQYSAFFELKDGIGLMNRAEIERIRRASPHAERDIRILQGIYEHETIERALRNSTRDVPDHPVTLTERLTQHQATTAQIAADMAARGERPLKLAGTDTWNKAKVLEEFLQERSLDMLLLGVGGSSKLPALYAWRDEVKGYNENLVSPNLMMAADYGTSLIKVLDSYVVEGRMTPAVWHTLGMEVMSRIPVLGAGMGVVSDPVNATLDMVSMQLIPGYGPLKVGIQFGVEAVKLAGHAVFAPLQRDSILLAYQGYLDPEAGRTLSSGQKERVESPRPALLTPIDPGESGDLEARRRGIYDYFYEQVVPGTIERLPDFDFKESVVADLFEASRRSPLDKQAADAASGASQAFLVKEREVLETRVRQFVLHWWNATGPFQDYDELTVHRTAGMLPEDFRLALENRLINDYYTGKNQRYQQQLNEEIALRGGIMEAIGERAMLAKAIDAEHRSEQRRKYYVRNGEAFLGWALDGMPTVAPGMEIWAVPVLDPGKEIATSLTSWATVSASEKVNPQPWTIEWKTDGGKRVSRPGEEFALPIEAANKAHELLLTATAIDANGNRFAEASLRIPLLMAATPEAVETSADVIPPASEPAAPDVSTTVGAAVDADGRPELFLTDVQWFQAAAEDTARYTTHTEGEAGFRWDWVQDLNWAGKGTRRDGGTAGFTAFPARIVLGEPFRIAATATAYESGYAREDCTKALRRPRLYLEVSPFDLKPGAPPSAAHLQAAQWQLHCPSRDWEGSYAHAQSLPVTIEFAPVETSGGTDRASYLYHYRAVLPDDAVGAMEGDVAIRWNGAADVAARSRSGGLTVWLGRSLHLNTGQIRLHYTADADAAAQFPPFVPPSDTPADQRRSDDAIASPVPAEPSPSEPRTVSKPDTTIEASAEPDPDDMATAALIREWLARAEPLANARGAKLRWDPWGRVEGRAVGGVITLNGRPDDAGGRSPEAYVWANRQRLDSLNLCTLEVFVRSRLRGSEPTDCRRTWTAEAGESTQSAIAGAPSDLASVLSAVRGKPWPDARRTLENAGFVVLPPELGAPAPTPSEVGTVDSVRADGGGDIHAGGRIIASVLGKPAAGVPVPRVVGLPAAEARTRIEAAGLLAAFDSAGSTSDTRRVDTVAAQIPDGELVAARGSVVRLKVLTANRQGVRVPDLAGKPVAQAQLLLTAAGLVIAANLGETADGAGQVAGQVYRQAPDAGSEIASGGAVKVWVYANAPGVADAGTPPANTLEPTYAELPVFNGQCPAPDPGVRLLEHRSHSVGGKTNCTYGEGCNASGSSCASESMLTAWYDRVIKVYDKPVEADRFATGDWVIFSDAKRAFVTFVTGSSRSNRSAQSRVFWESLGRELLRRVEPHAAPRDGGLQEPSTSWQVPAETPHVCKDPSIQPDQYALMYRRGYGGGDATHFIRRNTFCNRTGFTVIDVSTVTDYECTDDAFRQCRWKRSRVAERQELGDGVYKLEFDGGDTWWTIYPNR